MRNAEAPELLDSGHVFLGSVEGERVHNPYSIPCIQGHHSALPVWHDRWVEEGSRDRVRAAEESAVAYRLRTLLSRDLQSMGVSGNRRASLQDKCRCLGENKRFSWWAS